MKNKLVVFVLAAIALMVLPLVAQAAGNFWVRMIDFALLYVLLALGLNIVVGYAGLLDLGYVAFYAVGAYMFGLMASPHLSDTFEFIKATFPNFALMRASAVASVCNVPIFEWQPLVVAFVWLAVLLYTAYSRFRRTDF